MNKKFTLVELIVAIVVLGVLLSIVLLNLFDFKKKAIQSSMNQNIAIIQSEVDSYYMKQESYPIKSNKSLILEKPQLIDIDLLVKEGFQKKKLDETKVKNQFYWVDVFGKVWGSTKNELSSVNLLKSDEGYTLEALIGNGYLGYKLYEVEGYSTSSIKNSHLSANTDKDGKSYKVVQEYELESLDRKYIQHEFNDTSKTYLFSMIDEYGLEAAPIGKFFTIGQINSLIEYEGIYEFEITGGDIMYWVDFITEEDKPGKSSIDYRFKVKDEFDNYSDEWTTDFFSLNASKGIKVEVDMRGDGKGNKPSLYDLRVIFKYKDEEDISPVYIKEEEPNFNETNCPKVTVQSTLSKYIQNEEKGLIGIITHGFKIDDFLTLEEVLVPSVGISNYVKFKTISRNLYIEENGTYTLYEKQETKGKCMFVSYEVEILSVKKEINESSSIICGKGSTSAFVDNSIKRVVYSTYLEKGSFLTELYPILDSPNWIVKEIYIEHSYQGSDYKKAKSISEIKDESCVNFVYTFSKLTGFAPNPPIIGTCIGEECQAQVCGSECLIPVCGSSCSPIQKCEVGSLNCEEKTEIDFCKENKTHSDCQEYCITYQESCIPNICLEQCSQTPPNGPTEGDEELENPEWTTLDRLRFFGHGAQGQLTRWYKAEHSDSINPNVNSDEISLGENVRIVYRYASSNGGNWSSEYKDFATTGVASSVMGVAYIQVKTSKKDNIEIDKLPNVKTFRFYNEKGYLDMSMVQPTLTVIAKKDNNKNRNVFSVESNIEWLYESADPRNKKIVDIEWRGDKRNKYGVGVYIVEARVKNEVELWSEWVPVQIEVLSEKPIAVITDLNSLDLEDVSKNTVFNFSALKSSDPDQDGLSEQEWKNKKRNYGIGSHTVYLRVKDNEGYWSDWSAFEFQVSDVAYNVYRIEIEDTNPERFVNSNNIILMKDSKYSNEHAARIGGYSIYKFNGVGVDVSVYLTGGGVIIIDEGTSNEISKAIIGSGITKVRNLKEGDHTIKIKPIENTVVDTDFIDVYSTDDTPTLYGVKLHSINKGVESISLVDSFSPNKGEGIRVKFSMYRNSLVTFEVFDKNENSIYKKVNSTYLLGGSNNSHYIDWNGYSNNGDIINSGEYTIRITNKGVANIGTSKNEFSVFVSNDSPIYRIEIEDTNPERVIIPAVNGLMRREEYSNSLAVRLGYKISFKFEGTGLDLVSFYGSKGKMTIDPNTPNEKVLEFQEKHYFEKKYHSIRNLPFGQHVVEIESSDFVDIDYLDIYSSNQTPKIEDFYLNNYKDNIAGKEKVTTFNAKLNEKVKVNLRLFKDANVELLVKDKNGSIIYREHKGLMLGGTINTHSFVWDRTDSSGQLINSGDFSIVLVANSLSNRTKVEKSIPVKIESKEPYKKIEAEQTDPSTVVIPHPNGFMRRSEYSDLAVRLGGEVAFRFTGNAVDLVMFSSGGGGGVMIIDPNTPNEKSIELPERGFIYTPYNASIGGLSDGEHIVLIKPKPNGFVDIDYLNIYN